jgi:hypothetical protein
VEGKWLAEPAIRISKTWGQFAFKVFTEVGTRTIPLDLRLPEAAFEQFAYRKRAKKKRADKTYIEC